MPAVIPVHVALRSKLKDSVQHALALNERLKRVVAVKSRTASGGFHGKIDFSQPPWHAPVANAIMDLHAQSREAEGCLRASQKLPYRERGGSDGNTKLAMEAILRLSEAADDGSVKANTKWIEGWSRKASIALCETEAPRKLPRLEGEKERKCPFCECCTLRMLPLHGKIKCCNPECKDDEGRKPSAKLEYSEVAKDLVLVWQDSAVGLP